MRTVPTIYQAELNRLGYHDGRPKVDLVWELDYMPAIEQSLAGQDHRLDRMPCKYSSPDSHRVGPVIHKLRNNPALRNRLQGRQPVVYRRLVELGLLLNI